MAEVRVGIADRWHPMRSPAGVGDPQVTGQASGLGARCHLQRQLCHPRGTAGTAQPAVGCICALRVDRNSTGVIAAVFQPLQPLHQDRNNIAVGHRTDDSTHSRTPIKTKEWRIVSSIQKMYWSIFLYFWNLISNIYCFGITFHINEYFEINHT
jgi:hypothetical protein